MQEADTNQDGILSYQEFKQNLTLRMLDDGHNNNNNISVIVM